MKYINMILFIIIISGAIISCGDENKDATRKIEGYVMDANISKANVRIYKPNSIYYEANTNTYSKEYNISETNTTDKSGKYVFYIDSSIENIDIISYGGEDILSEEIFEGVLQARASCKKGGFNKKIFVTPLSTLLVAGDGNKSASKIIKYNLGIDEDFNLINDNPLSEKIDDELKLKLFRATQQVQKVAEIIKDALGNDIYYEQIFKAIYLTMDDNYNSNNRAIVNEKDILKSSKFISNVASFAKGDKEKAKRKLETIGASIESTIDIIYSDDVSIDDIKLSAMAIEVVTNSYEEKAKEINKAVNLDKDVFDLKEDMEDIRSSYDSLDKVKKIVTLVRNLAKEKKEFVSLPLLGAFLAQEISSNDINSLEEKNINKNTKQFIVSQETKNRVNNLILSSNLEQIVTIPSGDITPCCGPVASGDGGGSSGSGGGSSNNLHSGRGGGNNNIPTPTNNDPTNNNADDHPSIPNDSPVTSIDAIPSVGENDYNSTDKERVPDTSNVDKLPAFNLN